MAPMSSVLCLMVVVLGAPFSVLAKGRTMKMSVSGPSQSGSIVTMSADVGQFHVWEGPGTFVNRVPQRSGFVADWDRGPVSRTSESLPRYEVSFFTGCKIAEGGPCHSEALQLSYVVLYEYDEVAGVGYVYLPGRGERWYDVNTRSVLRGVEGQWFPATETFRRFLASFLPKLR